MVKHRAGRARVLGHGGYQDALTLDSFSRVLPSVIGGPGSCLRCAMGVLIGNERRRDVVGGRPRLVARPTGLKFLPTPSPLDHPANRPQTPRGAPGGGGGAEGGGRNRRTGTVR